MRLYGASELAEALGRPVGKVAAHLRRRRLPEPVVSLRCGPIWIGEQVDAFLLQ